MTTAVEAKPRTYETLLIRSEGAVRIIQLDRPQALNALSPALMSEMVAALEAADSDAAIRAIVLTGGAKAFAAGADINSMADASAVDMIYRDMIAPWDHVRRVKKPLIAATSGFCLGGGFELVMACDLIVASETAVFGQPEINIGVIPGAGGTQRLTRCVGKYIAMDMILTGRQIRAREALKLGLVSRVWPVEIFLEEAIKLAQEIAQKSPIALRIAKDAINKAFETTLTEGLDAERQRFHMLFATEDQKEGMRAFLEKRKAQYNGR